MSSNLGYNVTIAPGTFVCEERLQLVGEISIGTKTVLHPSVSIIAEAGPIYIGEGNLIEEQCVIANRFPPNADKDQMNQIVMIIGNNNVFEVGSHCEALKVGDNNILECKARVGRNITLTNGCVIGAKCSLMTNEILPENTVIYGSEHERRIMPDRPAFQTHQLDFLARILPTSHYVLKHGTKTHAPTSHS
ncbi:unnamed protein product [Didymodactylos carnosus]|uniref:Dynactin subunit 6 n=2 Tax=Didymodactylos carnosus TaxID=1234261 RepID=A0A813T451_9BILA|nr:unnamed protein product [Didymodactylos carnosus]CAF3588358.1 unnamed protein product [Didymodactylos carnosus]